jgi:hypothetical protein
MMTLCIVWEGQVGNNAFDRPTLLALWHVQEGIDIIQIEVMALEEASFLLSKKPRCPLLNPIGDNISTLVKQPPGCAPWNLFGNGTSTHVYKQASLSSEIARMYDFDVFSSTCCP